MKNFIKIFQIAAVFIGTIVGAGLASGKEITTFFTKYGYISFLGILLTGIFYIFICTIISKISIEHKLSSYSEAINLVSPNILGKITGITTTFYLISSASIILAGSGALLHQFFGIPKIVGSIIMAIIASFALLRETNGLVEINSVIVPSLVTVITLIMILYLLFCRQDLTISNILSIEPVKNSGWLTSTILYAGYNTLCCCGVIVPLSYETSDRKSMIKGIALGALVLSIICIFINAMLMVNQHYIYKYDIPLLYIILAEMFSTEVSDVYSISKTLNKSFKIKYKKSIFLVLLIALPISLIGFSNLISTLYPIFGILSLIFIAQCCYFYFFKMKK